jgi:hypothetical protein
MIGRIEETSASSKPDPRLDPTRLPLAVIRVAPQGLQIALIPPDGGSLI